jgi:hypothetical protein
MHDPAVVAVPQDVGAGLLRVPRTEIDQRHAGLPRSMLMPSGRRRTAQSALADHPYSRPNVS